MLLKSKAFTAAAMLSLAVGIGANTAVFSLVDAVLLKTLPVRKPQDLVLFNWLSGKNYMAASISGSLNRDSATGLSTSTSFSTDTFRRFSDRSQTLADLFAFTEVEQLNVNIDGQPEIASGQLVSGDYYTGLGVAIAAGRAITATDDQPAADPVAVISYRYWQRRFGLDLKAVGEIVSINGVPFTIIGVAAHGFEGTLEVGSSPDLSIALSMEPQIRALSGSILDEPGTWWLQIIGRLKPGETREKTRAELEGVFQQSALDGHDSALAKAAKVPPEEREGPPDREQPDVPTLRVGSGSQGLTDARDDYGLSLLILMAVVGLVLLIACANVATLLLSRAAVRQREIAVRLALGATKWRVTRQLLTESALLSALAGGLGVLLAFWGKDLLLSLRPWGGGQLDLDLRLDLRVFCFTAAVTLLTGVLFGGVPAFRAARLDLSPALKDNARSVIGGGRFGLTKALVIAQVAMSLLLVIGAGLFVRTLANLHSVDLGFNPENLLLFRVDPRLSGYKKDQIPNLYQQMLDQIDAVPGVVRATLSRHPLLSSSASITQAYAEGQQTSGPSSMRDMTWVQRVRANFLETMEIPIVAGRGLTEKDDERAPKVAVINQAMARKYFGDESPIGKRFGFESPERSREIEIVGVARDAKYSSIRMEKPYTAYLPYLQDLRGLGQMNFEVRTASDPALLVASIRRAVSQVDGNLPLFDISTQVQRAESSLASERLFATLSVFFGLLAVFLACLGLYGVMSYSVARRTREIGIRMALGAHTGDVVGLVMRESMVLVLMGVVIGLASALAATRLITSMLFGLAAMDPLTISFAVLIMIGVAAVAGFLPARRASQVDPMVALRYD
jgi:predicted permease